MNSVDQIKEILLEYKNIAFAYIFGSFVRNKMTELSDIDIAIYLYNEEISTEDYLNLKTKLEDKLKKDVDIAILNNASPLLKFEVCREGILLFSRDEILESNFKVHTLFEYEDFKKYRDMFYKNMIEKLRKEV
ncbi:DNA polymerase, beta domain protein region [Caldisalinibacter kiritimatiensis]|uniref:DNA polymerase, beta domain protein region n=2 Tax=Caldisalinibacter kiritimatiensis TaxID=1304284 RepID=R1CTS0_9FIRM|nr:nucleotidyltransferase domain-containing protein [Caldisalinibacter kiritimatiensis]EOD00084.1 DNA polymerase, beta domain protein region [Caldisalinibacter kiritimatiensis]